MASPDAELASFDVDRNGTGYIDFQRGLSDYFDGELESGQTAAVFFGIPAVPDMVDGGLWGIGPADTDATDVSCLT